VSGDGPGQNRGRRAHTRDAAQSRTGTASAPQTGRSSCTHTSRPGPGPDSPSR